MIGSYEVGSVCILPVPFRYPQCLHFLDLLQSDQFRRELANAQYTKFIEDQQLLHWHHYTKKRMQFQQRICELPCPSLGPRPVFFVLGMAERVWDQDYLVTS